MACRRTNSPSWSMAASQTANSGSSPSPTPSTTAFASGSRTYWRGATRRRTSIERSGPGCLDLGARRDRAELGQRVADHGFGIVGGEAGGAVDRQDDAVAEIDRLKA